MKLYYARGACSLSCRIMLHEAGVEAEFERVDLKTKQTETGGDFMTLNPKGSVPLLVLDDGRSITENMAVLSWIADHSPVLASDDLFGSIRLIEMLSYISTEIHIAFKPFFHDGGDFEKEWAVQALERQLEIVADALVGPYLFGPRFTSADAYLFVILRWAHEFFISVPGPLVLYFDRLLMRESVRRSLLEEGLV